MKIVGQGVADSAVPVAVKIFRAARRPFRAHLQPIRADRVEWAEQPVQARKDADMILGEGDGGFVERARLQPQINVAVEGMEDRAAAEYDVAVAQADGARKVAKEKCETLTGDAQQACKDQADAAYESAKAEAQATLDAAKRAGSAEPSPPAG